MCCVMFSKCAVKHHTRGRESKLPPLAVPLLIFGCATRHPTRHYARYILCRQKRATATTTLTGKKPGGIAGPPGMPSLGGIWPIGLGAFGF